MHLSLVKSPFRLRRWVFVGFFVALFWVMWMIVAAGRALDHVFYRGFLRQAVREPVFIVAPPRSGTTFLQKLMALDEATFVHAKLFQTIFPAVIYQRMFAALARLDACCGSPASRLVQWAEDAGFKVPQEMGVIHLALDNDCLDWAGIFSRKKDIGAATANLVITQIQNNQLGLPDVPMDTMVQGKWQPGKTLLILRPQK